MAKLWLLFVVVVVAGCSGSKASADKTSVVESSVVSSSVVSSESQPASLATSGSSTVGGAPLTSGPSVSGAVVEAPVSSTIVPSTGALKFPVIGRTDATVVVSPVSPGSFVVAYTDGGAVPGDVLGSSVLVVPGSDAQVTVKFAVQPVGSTVWLVLHRDVDNSGTLEYPGVDLPASGQFGVTSVSAKVGAK